MKELQRNLQALGFFEGSIGGNYLTLTEQAVKAYQTARGLTAAEICPESAVDRDRPGFAAVMAGAVFWPG